MKSGRILENKTQIFKLDHKSYLNRFIERKLFPGGGGDGDDDENFNEENNKE